MYRHMYMHRGIPVNETKLANKPFMEGKVYFGIQFKSI